MVVGRARKPRARSAAEAERAVQRFVELHGDLAVTAITKANGRALRDALALLPKALPERFSRLPLPELLKQDLIPAGVKADSLTGFQTGRHLTMSIGLRDWVNA
jgi:hypothetical protein